VLKILKTVQLNPDAEQSTRSCQREPCLAIDHFVLTKQLCRLEVGSAVELMVKEGYALHGAAQFQAEPQGLPVRSYGMGCGGLQEGRQPAGQAPLRHLPHAGAGGGRDRHDPRERPVHRPLPHGGRAGAA